MCDIQMITVLKAQLQHIVFALPTNLLTALNINCDQISVIEANKVEREKRMILQLSKQKYFSLS
jgi:hypothetical protein